MIQRRCDKICQFCIYFIPATSLTDAVCSNDEDILSYDYCELYEKNNE